MGTQIGIRIFCIAQIIDLTIYCIHVLAVINSMFDVIVGGGVLARRSSRHFWTNMYFQNDNYITLLNYNISISLKT